MKSSNLFKLVALLPFASTAVVAVQAASPLLKFGDGAVGYVVADAGTSYTDNLFGTHNKKSAVSFYVTPGIQLVMGGDSANTFTLTAKERLTAYANHSDLNSAQADIRAKYKYDAGSRLRVDAEGGFRQTTQNTNTISQDGDLIRRNIYDVGVGVSYDLTSKSLLEVGGNFSSTSYRNFRTQYNDQDVYSVPVSWLYQITDKTKLGFTYSYTYTDLDAVDGGAANSYGVIDPGYQQVHYLGATARGELSSKINYRLTAGVGYNEFNDRVISVLGVPVDDNPDGTTFNFELSADYQISEKVKATLMGGRKFEVGGQAQDITNTYVRLNANYLIATQWEANAYAGFSYQEFDDSRSDGTDKISTLGASVSYLPSDYWRVTLGYGLQYNDSDRIASYSINTVSLTATLKY